MSESQGTGLVQPLVEEGGGRPFVPAGLSSREWVRLTRADDSRWRALLAEPDEGAPAP